MTPEVVLLSDQVFQLNVFLWAVEDLPGPSHIQPVLRKAGYYLLAIGRRVLVPADDSAMGVLKDLTGSPDHSPSRPDLWLRHSEDAVQLLIELKGRAFSPESSNRKQAVKLLVSASDLASSLGQPTRVPGHVIYGTVLADGERMADTLKTLAKQTRAKGFPPAPAAVIGLSIDDDGVALSSPIPSDLPHPLAEALATPATILPRDDKNDLQPLYFVPWMPGTSDTQDAGLCAEGLRELTARVLTHAQSRLGRARVPATVSMGGDQLLQSATFGVFDRWQDLDKKVFRRTAIDMVRKALTPQVTVRGEGGRLDIDLNNEEDQDRAIKCLEQEDPSNPESNLGSGLHGQLGFFDT